eukprot:9494808-Pyramimonas_sp.AAC.1
MGSQVQCPMHGFSFCEPPGAHHSAYVNKLGPARAHGTSISPVRMPDLIVCASTGYGSFIHMRVRITERGMRAHVHAQARAQS